MITPPIVFDIPQTENLNLHGNKTTNKVTLFAYSNKKIYKSHALSKAPNKNSKPLNIRLKRVYEAPSKQDGCRVLIDRLWPRGLSKDAAQLDLWLREVAPSNCSAQVVQP